MDHRLIPTFCTSVVARLYSVIVRVKVAGARSGPFDLEVPLQVINSPPSNIQPEDLPTRDSQQSEDLQKESEIGLESDGESVRQNPLWHAAEL